MPCMSASGNISPTSISRTLPSCSIAMQLRPISPRPPRKTMRTGSAIPDSQADQAGPIGERARATAAGWPGPRGRVRRPRRALVPSAGGPGRPGRPRWRSTALVGSGFGASSPVSKAKLSSIRSLTSRAPATSPFSHRSNRSWWSGAGPVRGHPDRADGADGQQRQGHRVVAAVDLEAVGRVADDRRRRPRVARRVLEGEDVGHVAGEAQHHRRRPSCGRCARGCRRSSRAGRVAPAMARMCASMPACDGRL